MKKIIWLFLLLVATPCWSGVYSIPSTRTYPWQGNVGVSGDIPTDRTQCGSTIISTGDTTNRTSTIQSAINACGSERYVLLGPGTFYVSSLTLKSNMTLKGSGMGLTTLKGNSTSSNYIISWTAAASPTFGTARALASGYTKDSTTITTSVAHGWSPGDIILFTQAINASGDPPISVTDKLPTGRGPGHMIKVIAGTSGSTAVLDVPLAMTLDAGKSPTGVKVTNSFMARAGIEDLKIDNITSANTNQDNYGVLSMWFTDNCWIKNVDSNGFIRINLHVVAAYRATIKSNRIHNCIIPPANRTSNMGYLWWGEGLMSNSLVENNVLDYSHGGFTNNGLVVGNSFSYNYIHDLESSSSPNSSTQGIFFHGSETMFNLFEGNHNDGATTGGDAEFGGSAYNTFFRNKLHGRSDMANQKVGFALVENEHTKYTIVGNILCESGNCGDYDLYDWFPGSGAYGFTSTGSASRNTLLRHANYDYYNNAQKWCTDSGEIGCQGSTGTDHDLPNSLYLASKPSWFGPITWPPVDPVAPLYTKIPAQIYYETGVWQSEGSPGVPSAPKGLTITGGQ